MDNLNDIFKKYKPDLNKLTKYGFQKNKYCYIFQKDLEDGLFTAIVEVDKAGFLSCKVFDKESNDEFLPLKIDCDGAFVAEVRNELKKILTDIKDNCFYKNSFLFNQSNRISDCIFSKYGDRPEFMWEKFPEYGVFKNSDKWYGIIMNIKKSKLGVKSDEQVEIINLKIDKDKIQELLSREGFYPAWHMNKKYWISIILDNTLSDKEIMAYVDESYSHTL